MAGRALCLLGEGLDPIETEGVGSGPLGKRIFPGLLPGRNVRRTGLARFNGGERRPASRAEEKPHWYKNLLKRRRRRRVFPLWGA